jgi:signal transduction histidine kinase
MPEPERARPELERQRPEIERQRPELLRPREHAAAADMRGAEQARETFETVVQSLAHDLRNPLTTIKTLAGTLTTADASASSSELVALAGEACERIEGSLEAMQEYAAFGAPRKQPGDVYALLRQSVEASDGAQRIRMLVQGALEIASDAEQMRFVFDNLIAAALAEAGRDGEVVVAAETGPIIVIRVPSARGAVAKLHRLGSAQRQPVSWRIVLARAVAARNGWEVEVEAAADAIAIRCRPPGGEVGARDQQQ